MYDPEYSSLRLNGIKTSSSKFAQTISPIIWMHAKIMDGSTEYGYIFLVQQEGIRKGFQTGCDPSFSVIFIQSGKVHSCNINLTT